MTKVAIKVIIKVAIVIQKRRFHFFILLTRSDWQNFWSLENY